ncbi:MAG: DMT family transporter [Mariniphaga sp.]|nr:DMT family transporter [Mariniphaga sp.]
MIYLALSIIFATSIYITFKLSEQFSCNLFSIIIYNYLTASILGFGFLLNFKIANSLLYHPWTYIAILVGLLFTGMFFIIGLSSRKAGIAITTVASKMSMVIPVLFSIFYFSEEIFLIKSIGLFLAVVAVFLSLYKKGKNNFKSLIFVLPIVIFFGTGIIDTLVKFAQHLKIPENETPEFTSLVFLVALISGIIAAIFKKIPFKNFIHTPTLLFGILLGISNFGSLFFLIKALNLSKLDSSIVFAIINMVIVVLSLITGYFLFKEKLSKINLLGIFLAFLSLYLISYS